MSNRKKDKTIYSVFACGKCNQYSYVKKEKNERKKCYRCGYINKRKEICQGQEVEGLTAASDKIRELQERIAKEKLGDPTEFKTCSEFNVKTNPKTKKKEVIKFKYSQILNPIARIILNEIEKFGNKNIYQIPIRILHTKFKSQKVNNNGIKKAFQELIEKEIIEVEKEIVTIKTSSNLS